MSAVGTRDLRPLHVWSLSSGIRALSAHAVIDGQPSLELAETIGLQVKAALSDAFTIAHAILELETLILAGLPDCDPTSHAIPRADTPATPDQADTTVEGDLRPWDPTPDRVMLGSGRFKAR